MVDGETPVVSASRDGVEQPSGPSSARVQHAPVAALQIEIGQLFRIETGQPFVHPRQRCDHPLHGFVRAGSGMPATADSYSDSGVRRRAVAGISLARAAAGTFTAFAVGSIAAAPVAGWLADRSNPTVVAVLARIGLAVFTLQLAFAQGASEIWLAAAAFGAALALAQPAIQVILLARTPANRRRDVFAWQFIAVNLGAAGGAALGGMLVDLSSQSAMRPVYLVAAAASMLSAAVVSVAGRGAHGTVTASQGAGEAASYRDILRSRQVRWLLGIALLITLACYAQYDAGLPACVLDSTTVSPALLGTAVAINATIVAVLTGPVVAYTRKRRDTSLLAVCALLWVGC
jgi:MFS family permease